jgi:hypothetical protein
MVCNVLWQNGIDHVWQMARVGLWPIWGEPGKFAPVFEGRGFPHFGARTWNSPHRIDFL